MGFLKRNKNALKAPYLLFISIISSLFCVLIFIRYKSLDYFYEPGDGIMHFLYAKYAINQPELYFNNWAKQLFTLLSSPFAQIGFDGMVIFNLIVYFFTCFFAYKIGEILNLKGLLLIPFLFLSSPVYFILLQSGMTEPLFALFITITVYHFLKKQFYWSTALLSFTIFLRPEAYIIIPIYGIYLIIKKPTACLFLLLGPITYWLISSLFFNDFLWWFNQPYYNDVSNIYGHGDLFHFIKNFNNIFGLVLSVIFIFSFIILLSKAIKKKNLKENKLELFLLIFIPVFGVIGAHSFLWWKGAKGSLGLIRVIGTIIPLTSIGGVTFINFLKIKKQLLHYILISLLILANIQLANNFFTKQPYDEAQLVEKNAGIWLKENKQKFSNIYLNDAVIIYYGEINPFNNQFHLLNGEYLKTHSLQENDLIVWDAHFSPNEGKLDLDWILNNTNLN
ncbi:MAG: hypothetical protein Kow0079_08000 [Vicingaceae bacterium]